jgi:Polysaccharide lyase
MKIAFVAPFLILISASAAQETANFQWKPVLDPKTKITIRGIPYTPEFALHEWNIRRATDATTDVTRFEVRPGDQWDGDRDSGENKERSEFDGYKRTFAHGTDIWGAYQFFIEPGPDYRSDWTGISQMHGSKVRAFHVHFKEGRLIIYSEHIADGAGTVITARYNGPLSRNMWHNVVFHLRESASENGRLEFWRDGEKIVDFTGTIGAVGNQAYWKFGIYRGYGPISTPLAIQFANMKIGNSDLTERIVSPQAIK